MQRICAAVRVGEGDAGCLALPSMQWRDALVQPDTKLSAAALALATRGLAVFPLKANDKAPVTKHGFKDAVTDTKQIQAWWQGWPEQTSVLPPVRCRHLGAGCRR